MATHLFSMNSCSHSRKGRQKPYTPLSISPSETFLKGMPSRSIPLWMVFNGKESGPRGGTGFATFNFNVIFCIFVPKSTENTTVSCSSSESIGMISLSLRDQIQTGGVERDTSVSPLPNVKVIASSGTLTCISPL